MTILRSSRGSLIDPNSDARPRDCHAILLARAIWGDAAFSRPGQEVAMNRSTLRSAPGWRGSSYNLPSGNLARLFHTLAAILVMVAVMVSLSPSIRAQGEPPVSGDVEGIETLTHGPIHEAFAAPTGVDPVPGPIVPKQPPANIDE